MSYPSNIHDDDVLAGKDHELTLSTAAIFGIFFGLVALCAVFFGFGYSLGSHKSPTVLPAETSTSASAPTGTNFSTFKPAAGQPVGAPTPRPVPDPATTAAAATTTPPPHPAASSSTPAETAPAPIVRVNPQPTATTAPAHPVVPAAPQPLAAGLFVQVAAISVSHPDDATLMVSALRAKGYAASPHPAADNFIHILIGPFATRPAAEAILKRLSADGYTAYIK